MTLTTTISLSSAFPFNKPFLGTPKVGLKPPKCVFCPKIFASRREAHDNNYSGRLVDENLIVLRKRMHEMKMIERNYEPPANWTDWEKRYYASYDSIICEAMGMLQSQLMDTRPSFALGVMALIALSLPISTVTVFFHLMEITKGALAGIHPM